MCKASIFLNAIWQEFANSTLDDIRIIVVIKEYLKL